MRPWLQPQSLVWTVVNLVFDLSHIAGKDISSVGAFVPFVS